MDQVKTFPCPGCGQELVEGTGIPDLHNEGGQFMQSIRFNAPIDEPIWKSLVVPLSSVPQRHHYPYSIPCTLRALVAAVRSLDAGQRDAAQIREARAAVMDKRIEALMGKLLDALPRLGLGDLPTREDFQDRDPLIGNRCTHGLRLDEPCVKCDEATTHCDPPCGARHDQPAAAHHPTCRRRIESCPYQAKGGGKCALPYGHEHDGVHDKAPGYPEDRVITAPDADPVYGPCGVCGDNHVTEDHEAAPEGGR